MVSVLLGFDPWYWWSIDPRHWSCATTQCTGHNFFFNFIFHTSYLWEWLFAVVAARRSVVFVDGVIVCLSRALSRVRGVILNYFAH